jgi:hypothetical protein
MARHTLPFNAMIYRFLASCYAHMGRVGSSTRRATASSPISPVPWMLWNVPSLCRRP